MPATRTAADPAEANALSQDGEATNEATQGEAAEAGTRPDGKPANAKRTYGPGDTVPVQVGMPFEMHALLTEKAKQPDDAIKFSGSGSVADYTRHLLAQTVEYTLPPSKGKGKAATAKTAEEWLKSKQRSTSAQEHANKVYALIETLKAQTGTGNLDDLLARIGAQQAQASQEAAVSA